MSLQNPGLIVGWWKTTSREVGKSVGIAEWFANFLAVNGDEITAAAGGKVNGNNYVFNTAAIGNELTEGAEQKFFVTLSGVTPDDTVVVTVKEIMYEYNKTAAKEVSANAADNISHIETRSVIAK